MATNMAVKIVTKTFEANEVLKISDPGEPNVGIRTRIKPPVKPPCPKPFIETIVSSSAPLNPVMKERDRSRMDNAQRGKFPQQPGISEHDLAEFRLSRSHFYLAIVGIGEVILISHKSHGITFWMKLHVFRQPHRYIL